MNINALILNILLMNPFVSQKDTSDIMACHFENISFVEFCNYIYEEKDVIVFYKQEWILDIKINLEYDSISIEDAISLALRNTELLVSRWNNSYVILYNEKLISDIPDFEQRTEKTETSDIGYKKLTESEERYLTGRKSDVVETIVIGEKGSTTNGDKVKILGRIVEQETGEPIIGATMYVSETRTGAASDLNGFITIVLKSGKYNVEFESLGFQKQMYFMEIFEDGNFVIEMKKSLTPIQEVIVRGDRQSNIISKDPGLEKVSIKTIKELPMLMGDRDILRISEMLPGIVTVGEGSSGLNVRGGSSDQNAFYINKIPIYNTAHLFGFFPAFNADIIKDFSIFKGHIPVKYGGRLSSVFNIVTRQGNRKKFGAKGGINPVSANLTIEGPIKKDVLSILFSGRSSYSDWILSKITDPTIRTSKASFYDFSTALNYDLKESQLSLFVYNSSDKFQLSDINSYEYSNTGASIDFRHYFNSSFGGNITMVGSRYKFNSIDKQELSAAYEHSYSISHYEIRGDLNHNINENNSFKYGFSSVLYKLDRGTVKPFGNESLKKTLSLGNEQGLESSIYFSDTYNYMRWININAGIRYAIFTPLGPVTVYTYLPDAPVDSRYIEDSIVYNSNKPIKWYSAPDLRIAISMDTDPYGSVKLAFNQMHQNLFMLSNTITVAPNTQWKLADYHLKPSSSNQISLGVFRNLPKGGWETSLEVYYKKTNNLIEFKDGADFLSSPHVETLVLQGFQKAYGIEFFLKRSKKKLVGWLSYTYSHSIIKVDGEYIWDQINKGESYPSNYDIPHAINIIINYHFSRRVTLSSIVTYQKGRPITYPTSIYYIDNIPYTDYSKRNKYRIPDYFRTDISLTIEGNLKKNKLIHSSLMFSVYNLTGRKNPYSVYFKIEDSKIKSYKYSVIGVPFFTITWLFKFGNYAS